MLPPGPTLPSVLQTLAVTYRPFPFFDRCAERYGDPFTIKMAGFGDYVMLTAPELIKQVFTGDSDQLHAGEANSMLEPVVGKHSVLLLDGKPHLRQRRLLLPPLHGDRMMSYADLMAEIASAAVAKMPDGTPFSLHPIMQDITLQVILRAVFGLDEGAQMAALGAMLTEFTKPPPSLLVFLPTQYLPHADFPGSPYRTFLRRRNAVDAAVRAVIRARTNQADSPSQTPRIDVLSMLMAARDEQGAPMTEDELRDELFTMLIAGHETSATSLSWAFSLVLEHPAVHARLADELAPYRRLPIEQLGRVLAENAYLDAVIKESLRLRPILLDVVRCVKSPITIAGYEIPTGAFLTPCIYLAHKRAASWPEPDTFRPERFLGGKIDPYSWFPFGGGIRRCLGMAFALYEMKIVLGMTLLRARFSLADKRAPRPERRGITIAPSRGTRVVIHGRN